MRDWLPEDDLVWLVIDAVAQIDLDALRCAYRDDGQGRAAFDPAMMVGLLLYAYCQGVRSSRQVERRCLRDVAFRVVCGGLVPDHVTIARFRSRHAAALETVFTEVLRLCAQAGMVDLAVLAVDGTKVAADASWAANRTLEQIEAELATTQPTAGKSTAGKSTADKSTAGKTGGSRTGGSTTGGSTTGGSTTGGSTAGGVLRAASAAMIADAAAVDAAEDARFGDARGDELPEQLRTRSGRAERLARARDRLVAERSARQRAQQDKLDRWQARKDAGLCPGRKPNEHPPAGSAHSGSPPRANVTDPDARIMKRKHTLVTGYNALAVVTAGQVIVGADLGQHQTDRNLLHPTLDITRGQLAAAGVDLQTELGRREPTVLTDAGFVTEAAFTRARTDKIRLLAPAPKARNGQPPDLTNRPETARGQRRLRHPRGQRDYALRAQTIEPVFGQLKTRQHMTRFTSRGLDNAKAEWHLACAAHNLLKLHHRPPTTGPNHRP